MNDQDKILSIEDAFINVGLPLEDENFKDTPKRWFKFIKHYMQPYDPTHDLKAAFTHDEGKLFADNKQKYGRPLVLQRNIPFRGLCAHHLLPITGHAHVGYIPNQFVVGLSKISRVVYGVSHSTPSLQETIGNKIADIMYHDLGSHGSMVIINAQHGCMACRGIEEPGVDTITSHLRGVFSQSGEARSEFLQLMDMH